MIFQINGKGKTRAPSASASIPAVMYHSIGVRTRDWIWGFLTCPWQLFSGQLQALQERGYRSLSLDELHQRQSAAGRQAERLVCLTFDDGYLDNWIFAWPLMQRLGFTGTVYVNPEFVEDGQEPRPTLADCWAGRCAESDLPTRGFLNWGELRAMQASGVMIIGSHSLTHTWYPTSGRIVDYQRPGSTHPWLAWNAFPDRKPFYLGEDQNGLVPLGTPVYEHGRSLGVRRYFPDPAVSEACVREVSQQGGARFFARADWRERLDEVAAAADRGRGQPEQESEQRTRYDREILGCKQTLESRLQGEVQHFCFPGGSYNDLSWGMAEEAGFRTIVVSYRDQRRWHDEDPRLVRRISSHHRLNFAGRVYPIEDPSLLVRACEVWRGSHADQWLLRAQRLRMAMTGTLARLTGRGRV
jgi:peptidoglycan/xylan/chitin deacetylase (PgdA/CDA1 family)